MYRFLTISMCILSAFGLNAQQDTLIVNDTVPLPPQIDFLLDDSLKSYYVVEDDSMYTFEMINQDLDHLLTTYPEILFEEPRGKSEFGQDLRIIRLGRKEPSPNCIFLVGNIHAREDFSSKMVMKFLNIYLLSIDGKSNLYPRAASLLDSVDIYFMPVANPDGLKIAQEDFRGIGEHVNLYRDSIRLIESYAVWKANGKGIDLNRSFDDGNFEVKRGTISQTAPASEGYKGEFPAEPVETQFIQQFVSEKRPLITASFHTKGNILFWADAKTHPIFSNIDTKINKEAAKASGFELSSVSKNPADYGCGLENYVRSCYGLLGVCVELSEGSRYRSQWPDELFNEQVWLNAWEIPMIYVRNAVKYAEEIKVNSSNYLNSN